jgi:hypothetical protein
MDTSRQKTLKRVVNEIILENDIAKSQYNRLLSFAIRGVQKINLFFYGTTMKCAKIITDSNYMADLPSDYLDFVAIGIPCNGELISFTRDKRLIRTTTTENGVQVLEENNGEGVIKHQDNRWGYGATGGKNEYLYMIDLNIGKIIINSNEFQKYVTQPFDSTINEFGKKELQLWYMSSGVSLDGETMIDSVATASLSAYVMYQYSLRSPSKSKADVMKIQMLQREYENEINAVKMLRGSRSADEWTDFFCSLMHQSPGR